MSIDPSLIELRILLAEDDAFLRRITAQVLSGLRLKSVSMAEDGKDALSILNKNDVDLLITDIQMPRMNGLELIKQIRLGNTSRKPDLRTIVVTSFSTTEVVVASVALDVNGFLVKPIKPMDAEKKIGIAMREQVRLKDKAHYQQVNTDLQSITEHGKVQSRRINAAIMRESAEARSRSAGGREVGLSKLAPGMHLLEDLHTKTGLTLVSAGEELNESLINRIQELAEVLDTRQVRVK